MTSHTVSPTATRHWTLAGLTLALFALPTIARGYRLVAPVTSSAAEIVVRELVMFSVAAVLLWIAFAKERLSPETIGLRRDGAMRSVGWGVAGTLLCAAGVGLALAIAAPLGLHLGGGGETFKLPIWTTSLVILRAGVLEEFFYRGYAIERITSLTGSRAVAVAVPLAVFALGHYNGGAGAVLVAFVLGAVLTAFYLWRRNLVANMIAHVLIDAIPNVLIPLLAG